jgi:hypothetical protein
MSNPTAGHTNWYVDAYHRAGGAWVLSEVPPLNDARALFSSRVTFRQTGAGQRLLPRTTTSAHGFCGQHETQEVLRAGVRPSPR